jgi:adenylate kinase
MNARIIFLAGIHGVGKGSLADYLSKKLVVPNYSASSLIKLEKNKPVDSSKRVLEPTENQDFLVKAINNLDTNKQSIILDGHFVLLTSDGFFNVPNSTFKALSIDFIVLKTLDEKVVQKRLLLRDGDAPEISVLQSLQAREVDRAKEVSLFLNIEIMRVDTDYYDDMDLTSLLYPIKL